jgi:hypothetical protein
VFSTDAPKMRETVRPTVRKSSPGATLGRQSAVVHDDRMISLGRSSDDPNQDGLAKNLDLAQNLRSEISLALAHFAVMTTSGFGPWRTVRPDRADVCLEG